MEAAVQNSLVMPRWEELCRDIMQALHEPGMKGMEEKFALLKQRDRTLAYKTARQIVKNLLPGVCYQKFLDFKWSDIIDLIADQAQRNRALLAATESDPARRESLAPVSGRFDSRIFRPHSQLPCTQETAQARVQKALDLVPHSARILLLGDDDMVSVALAEAGFRNITAVDIDKKVIRAIQSTCDREGHDIRLAVHDLRKPAPRHLIADYDLVFFDPEYSQAGLELFFSAALNFTGGRRGTLYFVSLHLMSLMSTGLPEAEAFLNDVGVELLEFHQGFNIYPVPARLRGLIRLVNQFLIGSRDFGADGWALPYFLSDALLLRKL